MYLPEPFLLAVRSNTTSVEDAGQIMVICAFPLSGQYGIGSRVFFYIILTTCVIARRAEWLRNALLAPALVFPAVSALHGIVLASNHVPGAVDMDIFGAFQCCSLGLIAGTVAVRISRTYYGIPGRNAIFAWVTLLIAGLISLTIEFYRSSPTGCNPEGGFRYRETMCGLVCSEEQGPHSPLRRGSANDVWVIPAPHVFSFQTAVLVSAGCCIHAVVWLLYMLDKILREVERRRAAAERARQARTEASSSACSTPNKAGTADEVGTGNGMGITNENVIIGINVVVFGAAGLALLIIGERNFHSKPVSFEAEQLATIGQWSSIATGMLALAGSLLVPLHVYMAAVKSRKKTPQDGLQYKIAGAFVGLETGLDNLLVKVARKVYKDQGVAVYPRAPGEEYRLEHRETLARTEQNFTNSSRRPSISRGPSGEEERLRASFNLVEPVVQGDELHRTDTIITMPETAHVQHHEHAGLLAIPGTDMHK